MIENINDEDIENDELEEDNTSFLKKIILGFLLGLAVIIPGVSGSTIAVIFKLYDKIVYSISNIFKKFKYCILFLLPIALGLVIGFLLGFFTIQKLLAILPFALVALFAGIMLGSMPTLVDEAKSSGKLKNKWLIIIGILIPISIAILSIIASNGKKIVDVTFINIIIFIILGFVVAITQLVPGCSATATLMALGYFNAIINLVDISVIESDLNVIFLFVALILGFLIGVVSISKLINKLINKFKSSLYMLFVGLTIGSAIAMLFNNDMISVYKNWTTNGINYLDMILGICLFFIGFLVSLFLILKFNKKNLNK